MDSPSCYAGCEKFFNNYCEVIPIDAIKRPMMAFGFLRLFAPIDLRLGQVFKCSISIPAADAPTT